jgi:hypothetical protein
MRKLLGLVTILAILSTLFVASTVGAASTANITITATGSVISISVDPTAWDVGIVMVSETPATAINFLTLTTTGSEAVDVTIAGRAMENVAGDHVWALSNTAAPGADTIGMKAGLDDGDDLFDIIILNVGQTLEKLVDELDNTPGTQAFGLKFYSPTSGVVDGEVMEMIGAVGASTDNPRGLVLTGSID